MRTSIFLLSLISVAAFAEEPKPAPSLVDALQQAQKNAPADASNGQQAPTPAGANLLKAIEMAKQNQAAAPAADPAKVPAGQDLGALIKAIEEAKKKQAAQQ